MSTSPLPSTYTLKLTLPSLTGTSRTTRLLLIPSTPTPTWSSLASTIQLRFSLPSPPSALTYLDDSDDEITLASDPELAEFLLDVRDDQEIKLTVLRAPEQEPEQRTAESLLDSLRSALKQDQSLAGPVHRLLSKSIHKQRHHPYAPGFARRRGRGRERRRQRSVEVEELVLTDSASESDSVSSDESITEVQMFDEAASESESEVEEREEQDPRRRRPLSHHHHHRRGDSLCTTQHSHPSSRHPFKHHRPPFPPHPAFKFDFAPRPPSRHTRFLPSSTFDFDFPPHDTFDLDMSPEHEHGFRRPGRGRGGFGCRGRRGGRGRGGFGGRGDRMML